MSSIRPSVAIVALCVVSVVISACHRRWGADTRPFSTVAHDNVAVASRPPNILLIVIDTLRYDAIIGPHADDAPFLSALARAGTTFTNAYSTQDSTPASHFSMMSGFIAGWQTPLDDGALGLPRQLSDKGYDTFGVAANGNLSQATLRVLAGFRRYSCLYEEWSAMKLHTCRTSVGVSTPMALATIIGTNRCSMHPRRE